MNRFLPLACLLFAGCSSHQVARVVIPQHCMHVTISSFTKACETMKDGSLLCDGVKVQLNCIEAAK